MKLQFFSSVLKGIGQIFLQENVLSGLIILVAVFIASIDAGMIMLVGTVVSTLTAYVLKFNKDHINKGLYGFNGALVGVGLMIFFKANEVVYLATSFGAIATTLIMYIALKRKFAAFTSPFIIITWLIIFILKTTAIGSLVTGALSPQMDLDFIKAFSLGFSQVVCQANVVSGVLIILAILINSRIQGLYAVFAGALVTIAGAIIYGGSMETVNFGIWGYNGILCAIVFAGTKKSNIILTFVSLIISSLLLYFALINNYIALTAPFVLAVWLTKLIKVK